MTTFTLHCGHTWDRNELVKRAICVLSESICPVCSAKFTDDEGFYLEYAPPEQSLEEWKNNLDELNNRIHSMPTTARNWLPDCSGICKNGKKCTKSVTRSSGKYCNLHCK